MELFQLPGDEIGRAFADVGDSVGGSPACAESYILTAMGRIDETLARARAEGRLALVAYVTCGFPRPAATPSIVRALIDGGADMIELGVPFSDPVADGATIQKASFRALEAGMTVSRCLEIAARSYGSSEGRPLILMSYANPILAFGVEAFVEKAAAAGVDGLIVVDLPPEDGAEGALSRRGHRQRPARRPRLRRRRGLAASRRRRRASSTA